MSDVNYVVCDRCRKVIDSKEYSIFMRWTHGVLIKNGKSEPAIDLCPRCTEDFDKFMHQFLFRKESKI